MTTSVISVIFGFSNFRIMIPLFIASLGAMLIFNVASCWNNQQIQIPTISSSLREPRTVDIPLETVRTEESLNMSLSRKKFKIHEINQEQENPIDDNPQPTTSNQRHYEESSHSPTTETSKEIQQSRVLINNWTKPVQNIDVSNSFNNHSYNPEVSTKRIMLLIFIVGVFSSLPAILSQFDESFMTAAVISKLRIHKISFGLGVLIYLYCNNQSLRKFVFELYQEMF